MKTQRIDGKAVAKRLRQQLAATIETKGLEPCLATVLVGEDEASALYVRMKSRDAEKLGIRIKDHHLDADVSQQELEAVLDGLNADPEVDGILLQLPLPPALDAEALLARIDPDKDVDGFHPVNLGRLMRGQEGLRSCTPAGCMDLIAETGIELEGKNAVVVGRSNIVGKPVALMLLAENCTVTVCHSRTVDLAGHVRQADLLVAAVGRPGLIPGEWIKPGAVVIDVGSPKGDVDAEGAQGRAAWLTPVPGGVGPMTRAHLMKNTVLAHQRRHAEQ